MGISTCLAHINFRVDTLVPPGIDIENAKLIQVAANGLMVEQASFTTSITTEVLLQLLSFLDLYPTLINQEKRVVTLHSKPLVAEYRQTTFDAMEPEMRERARGFC